MSSMTAVKRHIYGWYPRVDVLNFKCIVLFGIDLRRNENKELTDV